MPNIHLFKQSNMELFDEENIKTTKINRRLY